MSNPGASHKSISIADQSTPSEKAARRVMLVSSAKGRPDIFSHWHLNPLFERHLRIANHLRISGHRQGRSTMKIVVIGGTGLIGSKTVAILLSPC
jgi:hypothetical protein